MWIFKRKPKVDGYIAYFGLTDWWLSTFTESERNHIEDVYRPLGSDDRPLTSGEVDWTSQKGPSLLSGLANWFKEPEDWSITCRFLDKADELLERDFDSLDIIDVHFIYHDMITITFKHRKTDPNAFDMMVVACKKQIAIAPQTAQALIEERSEEERMNGFGWILPGHYGYSHLIQYHEGRGNYSEAIQISEQAKDQGWNGNWDNWIAKCEKKLQKGS
jgi:hypothetical protein